MVSPPIRFFLITILGETYLSRDSWDTSWDTSGHPMCPKIMPPSTIKNPDSRPLGTLGTHYSVKFWRHNNSKGNRLLDIYGTTCPMCPMCPSKTAREGLDS